MTIPMAIFWLLLLISLFNDIRFNFFLFFAALPFGDLNIVPAGAFNVLASSACALTLILRVGLSISMPKSFLPEAVSCMVDPKRLGLLFLFVLISVFMTFTTTSLFQGLIDVINVPGTIDTVALRGTNYNQCVNVCISFGTVLVFFFFAADARTRRYIPVALLINGCVLAATGLINLVVDTLGLSILLDGFHTTTYVRLLDAEVLGVRRLVGLMTEASAYGGACVACFVTLFFLQFAIEGRMRILAAGMSALLFVLAVLSTSSTAYAGLGFSVGVIGLFLAHRAFSRGLIQHFDLAGPAFALMCALLAFVAFLALAPGAADYASAMLDATLFEKASSSSYVERMQWNEVAVRAFLASDGLGVGLGSTRASNWFVAVLSSTGIAGFCALFAFLIRILVARAAVDRLTGGLIVALRYTVVTVIFLSALAATNADFGVGFSAIMGLLAGLLDGHARDKVWFA